MEANAFVDAWNGIAMKHYLAMVDKGFWDKGRNNGELIALMHAELSEALEATRELGGPHNSEHIPEFTGLEEEMADLVLRVMDFCVARGVDLPAALIAKMRFNATRPQRHGKAF